MNTASFCAACADHTGRRIGYAALPGLLCILMLLSGCMRGDLPRQGDMAMWTLSDMSALPQPAGTVSPPPVGEVLSLQVAVEQAAEELFASVPARYRTASRVVAVDPLVDGVTGAQTVATRTMQDLLEEHIRQKQPAYEIRPLNADTLASSPVVLVGSIRGVTPNGPEPGQPVAHRIWFSLADIRTGTVIGHSMAWADAAQVDATPTGFFRESPVWVADRGMSAYLQTCLTGIGGPVPTSYLDGILAAALVAEAITAYEAGAFDDALSLYESARRTTMGNQLRVHNGLYLAQLKLGRLEEAEFAFAGLVDFGLSHERLAMQMLFQPSSTAFLKDAAVTGQYPMWVRQLARGTDLSGKCLGLIGHTSATGPVALNERLSLARAERVRAELIEEVPLLQSRIFARGAGSNHLIIGTGRDDSSDALDRRVEFQPFACGLTA